MTGSGAVLRVPRWIVPAVVAAVALMTSASIVVALLLDEGYGAGGVRPVVLLGIFLAVSMIELLTTRVIVLPAQFTGGQAQIANGAATPQGLVDSAAIVSGAFSVAPAIYGACLAGYAADMLYVLPFPFIALATLGVLMPYVSESAGELARALSVDAIA